MVEQKAVVRTEILEELEKLTVEERLMVVEAALRLIREELGQPAKSPPDVDEKQRLAEAARALLRDYQTDSELTAFTALDGEDFYASG